MSGYILKPSGQTRRYRADFCGPMLKRDEVLDADLGWIVQGTTPDKQLFFLSEPDNGADWTETTIHGGTPGDIYMITTQARTNLDRVLRRTFVVRITA